MTAPEDIKNGGTPRGPDGGRHVPFRYATAIDDGREVGMLYTMDAEREEWLLADIEDVVEVADSQ